MWRRWFFALLIVAALVGAMMHFADIRNFARLTAQARPGWLSVAIVLQISTYAGVASGWKAVLDCAQEPLPFGRLFRLAVSKLFADQAVPSAGLGGNVLLIEQLRGCGVERGTAAAVLILSMMGFYLAYAVFALVMLVLLWLDDRATLAMAGIVTVFLIIALSIPALILALRHLGGRSLPDWIDRIRPVRMAIETIAQAPVTLVANRPLLIHVAACNALIFMADALTLWACLLALGRPTTLATAFIAYMMASIITTIGPIPAGLGSFETTSTAMLHLLGEPVEAAFAGTMLLRLLTLWLPLLPGLALMRGAIRSAASRPTIADAHAD